MLQRTKAASESLVRTEKHGAITAYTLPKNGLSVLYARVKGSPTISTCIVYNVGSRHERTGETGLAHMLEHMLFKPTTGTGIKWKDLENKGALLNASTWLDRTEYHFNLPKEYLSDMLAVEADRMRNTIFTDNEFIPERANVTSEYQMYNSRPEVALDWHITATAFQTHGYHHDTIGFKSDIERYTTDSLKAFYDRYYWPNNATLIIAGDIQEKEISEKVVQWFGSLSPGPKILELDRVEEAQEGIRRVTLSRPTPIRLINISFKAPSFSSPDWIPLLMGLNYLTQGETSLLYTALVDTGLATEIGAHLYPTHDPYLATFSMFVTEKAPYSKIESIVLANIKNATEKPISSKSLSLLKETLYAEELFSRDGSMAIARSLTEYVASGNWRGYHETLGVIEKVTSTDITTALKKYLKLSNATIGTIEPL